MSVTMMVLFIIGSDFTFRLPLIFVAVEFLGVAYLSSLIPD